MGRGKAKVKKVPTTEQQLKALNRERADIVAHLEKVKKRLENQSLLVVKQTTNLDKRLLDVDAKIAALTPAPVDPALEPAPEPAVV